MKLKGEFIVNIQRLISASIKLFKPGAGWVLGCVIALSGCGYTRGTPVYEELLTLGMNASATEVRRGEGLVVEIELKNICDRPLTAWQLNAESLSFWVWGENTQNRLRRVPAYSPNEDMTLVFELPESKGLSRRFLFTSLTELEGTYYLQALYKMPMNDKPKSATTVSKPLKFSVRGEPILQRGDDGLIDRESAIRVASNYLGRSAAEEKAELIVNEAGFFDWRVTLSVAPEALAEGERAPKAYFVNPYLGIVRKEARPDGGETSIR